MHVLLVRPHVILALARRFNAFLHLEPLDLEIVAGAVEPPDDVAILDLSYRRRPFAALRRERNNAYPRGGSPRAERVAAVSCGSRSVNW